MGSVCVCLCYFPTFPCRHCKLSPTHFLQPSTSISLPLRLRSSQSSATTRKSRRKSDAEICNDIREFLASVSLPEDHIPSTKELLLHGWNNLANIVRRRGHKQIKELLTRSLLSADVDGLSSETSLYERLDTATSFEDPKTGQSEKVNSLVDDVECSTEFLLENSSGSLSVDFSSNLDEGNSITEEPLVNLYVEEDGLSEVKDHAQVFNDATEENLYPTEVTVVEDDSDSSREGLYPNFGIQSSIMPTEISGELPLQTVSGGNSESENSLVGKIVGETTLLLTEKHSDTSFNDYNLDAEDKKFSPLEPLVGYSLEQKDLGVLEGLDDDNDDIAEDVATASEVSVRENFSGDDRLDSIVCSADSSYANLNTSANLSLKEKVAKFIQNGDLDPVEGIPPPEDNNVIAHGNSLTSKENLASRVLDLDQHHWDDHLPHKDVTTHFDKDVKTEAPKVQNESEINHLKFMLYQKELELSRLKEQIEKEKLALSVLQTKAEAEISKARKLISEKDAELHVAEESLSGLKEVPIEFCGDGDVVEVAGSFNGWHHRIKMDCQPSISAIDIGGSRRSRVWSTMLWLYPGVYEVHATRIIIIISISNYYHFPSIKFVVDGKWITDPQRESVTRGHICNNILRVDR